MKREKEVEVEETDVFADYQKNKRTAEFELLKLKARAKFVK